MSTLQSGQKAAHDAEWMEDLLSASDCFSNDIFQHAAVHTPLTYIDCGTPDQSAAVGNIINKTLSKSDNSHIIYIDCRSLFGFEPLLHINNAMALLAPESAKNGFLTVANEIHKHLSQPVEKIRGIDTAEKLDAFYENNWPKFSTSHNEECVIDLVKRTVSAMLDLRTNTRFHIIILAPDLSNSIVFNTISTVAGEAASAAQSRFQFWLSLSVSSDPEQILIRIFMERLRLFGIQPTLIDFPAIGQKEVESHLIHSGLPHDEAESRTIDFLIKLRNANTGAEEPARCPDAWQESLGITRKAPPPTSTAFVRG